MSRALLSWLLKFILENFNRCYYEKGTCLYMAFWGELILCLYDGIFSRETFANFLSYKLGAILEIYAYCSTCSLAVTIDNVA